MSKTHIGLWLIWSKIILAAIVAINLVGFWYFESSLILKILVAGLTVVGFITLLIRKTDQPPLHSPHEFTILLILYLGIFNLYNLLYGLSIPLYLVMIAILILVSGLFFSILILDKINTIISPPLLPVFMILLGLVVLEVFLSLSFWPIDPKIKSLIIVIIFYLIANLIYLHAHNVLKLKQIIGILIVSAVILTLLIANIWFGLKGGL